MGDLRAVGRLVRSVLGSLLYTTLGALLAIPLAILAVVVLVVAMLVGIISACVQTVYDFWAGHRWCFVCNRGPSPCGTTDFRWKFKRLSTGAPCINWVRALGGYCDG